MQSGQQAPFLDVLVHQGGNVEVAEDDRSKARNKTLEQSVKLLLRRGTAGFV